MQDVLNPPISEIGALPVNAFMKKAERKTLAAALNSLLAAPTFANWRSGATLDVAEWVAPKDGRTPITIVSVAHLDDEERALVLGVLLEEVLSWVRTLPGSSRLRALLVFDEVYGFLPPHPHNPPTKRPLVALMKQARAFGVGIIVATQNPMDLDYLSNAGLWCLGRLQTDADRARALDGMAAARGADGMQEEFSGDVAKIGAALVRGAQCARERGGAGIVEPAVCDVAVARADDARGDPGGAGGWGDADEGTAERDRERGGTERRGSERVRGRSAQLSECAAELAQGARSCHCSRNLAVAPLRN